MWYFVFNGIETGVVVAHEVVVFKEKSVCQVEVSKKFKIKRSFYNRVACQQGFSIVLRCESEVDYPAVSISVWLYFKKGMKFGPVL